MTVVENIEFSVVQIFNVLSEKTISFTTNFDLSELINNCVSNGEAGKPGEETKKGKRPVSSRGYPATTRTDSQAD